MDSRWPGAAPESDRLHGAAYGQQFATAGAGINMVGLKRAGLTILVNDAQWLPTVRAGRDMIRLDNLDLATTALTGWGRLHYGF